MCFFEKWQITTGRTYGRKRDAMIIGDSTQWFGEKNGYVSLSKHMESITTLITQTYRLRNNKLNIELCL